MIQCWLRRERAAAFLAAGLSALSLMLQQMQTQGSNLNSATLMRSILQAYILLATAPESFLAVAGQMTASPRHTILKVCSFGTLIASSLLDEPVPRSRGRCRASLGSTAAS